MSYITVPFPLTLDFAKWKPKTSSRVWVLSYSALLAINGLTAVIGMDPERAMAPELIASDGAVSTMAMTSLTTLVNSVGRFHVGRTMLSIASNIVTRSANS